MTYFGSFEEALALVGGLIAAFIVYKIFKATILVSTVTGLLTALAIAYLTFFEFTLQDDVVTYRNHALEWVFPPDRPGFSAKREWPGRIHQRYDS